MNKKVYTLPLIQIFILLFFFISCSSRKREAQNQNDVLVAKIDSIFSSPTFQSRLDFKVRDPFILKNEESKTYFLYRSQANEKTGNNGVACFLSKDLENWVGPYQVCEVDRNFWGPDMVWAPEVHKYNGKYYLFTTFTNKGEAPERIINDGKKRQDMARRGSAILVSNSPFGPFKPFKNSSHTPTDWMALDGTLYVEDGIPYMIFCHEWVQIGDGTMELIQLTKDLSDTIGTPTTLFQATEAPWVRNLYLAGGKYHGYITDGAFLYQTKGGKLLMIWSSFGDEKYAVGQAVSESGKIAGPWTQVEKPLFKKDGGHGMIFKTFDGKLMLTIHQPNGGDKERARFFELEERNDLLYMKQ